MTDKPRRLFWRHATLVLAMALLVGFFANPVLADSHDCKLEMVTSLPMQQGQMMIFVPATLGTKSTSLLVDTGGFYSMVGSHIVDELNAHVGKVAQNAAEFRLINGSQATEIADIEPFALGNMKAPSYKFLVLPDGVVASQNLDGAIGPDILANFDVELDFANNVMNLFSQDHCPGKVVYWAKDWAEIPFQTPSNPHDKLHIELNMTLDGKPMVATLDTGASSSFISAGTAKSLFLIDASSPDAKPLAANPLDAKQISTFAGAFSYPFKSLSTNGLAIANPNFVVLANDNSSQLDHFGRMLLGMPEIRKFHIYIAYRERVLYVTAANAH